MVLQEWETDPGVSMVLMKGAGEKAFCAGGDIRGERWSTSRSLSERVVWLIGSDTGLGMRMLCGLKTPA